MEVQTLIRLPHYSTQLSCDSSQHILHASNQAREALEHPEDVTVD